MELIHTENSEDNYYNSKTDTVDMVKYIKTVIARNFIEEIYSLLLDYPEDFKKALNEIEYLYSKELNCFVYPPKDYIQYKQGNELLRKVAQ